MDTNDKEFDPVYGYVTKEAEGESSSSPNTLPPTDTGDTELKKAKGKSFRGGFLVGSLSTLAIVVILVLVLVVHALFNGIGWVFTDDVESKANFIEALIHELYYKDVDDETMKEGIYAGIVDSIGDPYSRYYSAKEYDEAVIDTTGIYGGIGASLQKDQEPGEVVVVNIYDGVPADKAGLKEGDILVSADGQRGVDMDLEEYVRLIRGEAGTTVEIVYRRDDKENTVTITRDRISIPTVDHRMLDGNVGYIRISEFNSPTADEFREALYDLQAQGMTSVIFDLRSNPGGLVDVVSDVLDEILPEGTVVYMESKNGDRSTYRSDAKKHLDIPIAVLVDGYSASASEIFAGAIRDFKYGTLIGTQTYGKGVVQSTLPLSDGSAVKITIAQYFTPSGECIEGVGIKPDIELEYEYTGDEEADEYDYSADNQVQKAIEILTKE